MKHTRTARKGFLQLRRAAWVLVGLLAFCAALDAAMDEPLRRKIEREMNAKLRGYTASIAHLDWHVAGMSMDLTELTIRQAAHPDPPLLFVPELEASVQWRSLLLARLVADFKLKGPSIHANLVQMREEFADPTPLRRRGWQDAVQAIYPLKINELIVEGGSLVYEDGSGYAPLRATGILANVRNIRNIQSSERRYPSSFHVEGRLFESGLAELDGNADFLAKPRPGIKTALHLERLDLSYFEPLARRLGFTVRRGELRADGWVENSAALSRVDLESIVITKADLDYLLGAPRDHRAVRVARKVGVAARRLVRDPESSYRIQRLAFEHGSVGLVNVTRSPQYRLYVTDADFELLNLSSAPQDGPATAWLRGAFLGTGATTGTATFDLSGDDPKVEVRLEIVDAELKRMNDFLRAHAHLDVAGGRFSLYTELKVQDRMIDGYVKPLFRDIDVFDPQQDKKKNVFHKLYEGIAGGMARVLENRKHELATEARIFGSLKNPRSNPWKIVSNLVRNAFSDAILPGFEREAARAEPLAYRRRTRANRQ